MPTLNLPPGPRKKFLGDRLLSLQRDPLGYLQKLEREYGDVVHFKIGPQHMIVLNHPDDIRDVLVTHSRNFVKGYTLQQAKRVLGEGLLTSEGEYHKQHRHIMQPIFHRQQIARFAAVMVEYATRTAARWREGETFDVSRQMQELTLAIAAKTLLDSDVEGEASELGNAVNELMGLFNPVMLLMADWIEKLPLPPTQRLHRCKARLDETIYRLIAEHRANERGDDLLSMLLQAQDSETPMSDEQLRDEVLVIILAGYETISNALAWTWYLLSTHPEVNARFHAELDAVLDGRQPTAADVESLVYTRMILSETLRMYPSVWFLDRRAVNDYEVGGYLVPAGSMVLMSQWLVQHDPRFYTEPMRFDPQRWTTDAQTGRHRFAYFPFGAGPRVCVGEHFAWMEGVLLMATIGQRWNIQVQKGYKVVPTPSLNLHPKGGIKVRVEARSHVENGLL